MDTAVDAYAHPSALVSTAWVAEHLDDPSLRLVEVDVDAAAHEQGHLRNAVGWNWQTQLSDRVRRDPHHGGQHPHPPLSLAYRCVQTISVYQRVPSGRRCFRTSAASIGPNVWTQRSTVFLETPTPRSASSSGPLVAEIPWLRSQRPASRITSAGQ